MFARNAGRLTLAMLISLSPLQAMAAASPGVGLAPLQGLQGTLGIQAGEYKFDHYDKGALHELVLKQAMDAQEVDRQYILTVAAEVEVLANGLVANEINGSTGIQTLADKYRAEAKEMDMETFLRSYRSFETSVVVLKNKLASIQALPNGVKSKEQVSLEGSGIVELRTKGKVDLSQLISFYKTQIETLSAQVANITVATIALADGERLLNQKVGFIVDKISKANPYTPEQLQAMIDEETRLRNVGLTDMKTKVNQHNVMTRRILDTYVEKFGKNQQYRVNTTKELRKQIMEELQDVFWSRSLLRATYGQKLGAIAIKFNTKKFNLEYLFASNQIEFLSSVVYNKAQIDSQRREILMALQVMDTRNDAILGAETALTNRIFSTITFIEGNAQLADVNVEVLKMIYADMSEEAVLSMAGPTGMVTQYQTRWYAGENGIDEKLKEEVRARSKDWRTQSILDTDTPRGTFFAASQEFKKFSFNLDKADKLKAVIDTFYSGDKGNEL